MKTAIFYLEKVIGNGENGTIRGKRYVRVDGWENVVCEVPIKYTDDVPFFVLNQVWGNIALFIHPISNVAYADITLYKGALFSKDVWFNEIEPALKAAGERLSKILKEEKWHGKFEVKI